MISMNELHAQIHYGVREYPAAFAHIAWVAFFCGSLVTSGLFLLVAA